MMEKADIARELDLGITTSDAIVIPALPVAATARPVDPWRIYKQDFKQNGMWWTWSHGVVDLRHLWAVKATSGEGAQYRAACRRTRYIVKKRDCQFKIGALKLLHSKNTYRRSVLHHQ